MVKTVLNQAHHTCCGEVVLNLSPADPLCTLVTEHEQMIVLERDAIFN